MTPLFQLTLKRVIKQIMRYSYILRICRVKHNINILFCYSVMSTLGIPRPTHHSFPITNFILGLVGHKNVTL